MVRRKEKPHARAGWQSVQLIKGVARAGREQDGNAVYLLGRY